MSNRILDVLEAVAVYGPSTLDQISGKIPRTRSSVYRALVELERNGWIRRSINGRSFTVSCKMEKLSDLQFNVSDDVEYLLKSLKAYAKGFKCTLTVVGHVRAKEFAIIDSNQFPSPLSIDCEEIKHFLSSILHMLRASGLLAGANYANSAVDSAEAVLISELNANGFIYSSDLEMGIVPIVINSGELIMIICRNRDFSVIGSREVEDFSRNIFDAISHLNVFTFKNNYKLGLVAE